MKRVVVLILTRFIYSWDNVSEIEVRHEAEKFRLEADNTKQEFDHVKDLALKRKAVINDLLKQVWIMLLELVKCTIVNAIHDQTKKK